VPEKLIFLDIKVSSKNELFATLATQAYKSKVVSNKSEFLQSVIDREEQITRLTAGPVTINASVTNRTGSEVVKKTIVWK